MLETIRGYISQERINQASHVIGGVIQTARRGITQLAQNPRGSLTSTIEKIKQAYNTVQNWVSQQLANHQVWDRVQQFVRDLRAASVRLSANVLHPILNT